MMINMQLQGRSLYKFTVLFTLCICLADNDHKGHMGGSRNEQRMTFIITVYIIEKHLHWNFRELVTSKTLTHRENVVLKPQIRINPAAETEYEYRENMTIMTLSTVSKNIC